MYTELFVSISDGLYTCIGMLGRANNNANQQNY